MGELSLERFHARAAGALRSAQQIADREQHRDVSPVHLLRALLADAETFAFAEKRGGDPATALAKATAHSHPSLTSGLPSFAPALMALVRAAESIAARDVVVGDLFIAAERTLKGTERDLFILAVGPLHARTRLPPRTDVPKDVEDDRDWRDDDDPADSSLRRGHPEPTERAVGPLRPSARLLAILGGLEDAHQEPQPWAPWLPCEAVIAAEQQLGTTLPDDFWSAVAARRHAFAREGIAALPPHGEPARLDDAVEVVLQAASDAQSEASDDLVVFMDRRESGGAADLVAVARGVPFADRNRAPIHVISAGSERRAPYPSFVDLLENLVSATLVPFEHVAFEPALGRAAEPVPAPPPQRVRHVKFGRGTVLGRTVDAGETKLDVAFDDGSRRVLLARFVVEQQDE